MCSGHHDRRHDVKQQRERNKSGHQSSELGKGNRSNVEGRERNRGHGAKQGTNPEKEREYGRSVDGHVAVPQSRMNKSPCRQETVRPEFPLHRVERC